MSGRTIGVTLNDKEEKKLKAFIKRENRKLLASQKKTMSKRDFKFYTGDGKYPYHGATGGAVTYIINPCSIGTSIQVSYCGGEPYDITDYDSW